MKLIVCESCEAEFRIKHSLDDNYYKEKFCPFCGEELQEELQEKLHAKTATSETNDNLNFVHDIVINPSEFQQEYLMNTEITIKEEPIE